MYETLTSYGPLYGRGLRRVSSTLARACYS